MAIAFAVGLLLFVVATRRERGDAFFRAGDVPPSTAEPDYAPLPTPTARNDGAGIGTLAPPASGSAPIRMPAPAIAAPSTPAPSPARAASPDRKPRPIPGQSPPPDYPARALRAGETGTVLVLVRIGPDGVPTATELAQSSGSRDLDREALQTVRGWRFEPAIADGHPSVGEAVVPIDFKLE